MSEEEESGKKKKPDKTVEHLVKHTGLPEVPKTDESGETEVELAAKLVATREKLEERTSQLSAIALKEFEVQKNKLLSTIKNDERREWTSKYIGGDPERLKQVKAFSILIGKAIDVGKEIPDSGTGVGSGVGATVPDIPSEGTLVDSRKAQARKVIADLYRIQADPTKTQMERDEADRRINGLFMSFIKGAKQAQIQGRFPTFSTILCQACGQVIPVERGRSENAPIECPDCGWKSIDPSKRKGR